jgi:hypothetical protein
MLKTGKHTIGAWTAVWQNSAFLLIINIDTSLGAIPLGVNDLVMIFPVLLAAGFYLYVSLMLEMLHIRGAFRIHSQQLDPRLFSNAYIALIAPLWIDPLGTTRQWLPRLLILFLPAIVLSYYSDFSIASKDTPSLLVAVLCISYFFIFSHNVFRFMPSSEAVCVIHQSCSLRVTSM